MNIHKNTIEISYKGLFAKVILKKNRMTTYIKAKLIKLGRQTNIEKYSVITRNKL